MQAVDQQVIGQVRDWLLAGRGCWLATVVATYGSSPRPVGSLFACDAEGRSAGSLSGGCVEEDLLAQLGRGEIAKDRPLFFRYGETDGEIERLGLPCGGHLDIVIEPLAAAAAVHFDHIADRLRRRGCVERTLRLEGGAFESRDVEAHAPLRYDHAAGVLRRTFGPQHHLFVIGTNMVAAYVAEMALALGYDVTVCDPRAERLRGFDVAGARKIHAMPDDAVRERASDPRSAIVALNHDPRIDDMGMMEALNTDAFYIGAMGSSRTSAKRRERLLSLEVPPERLARLRAPIGLPIGSKTPPEIAVAILAEITAVRQRREGEARGALADAAGDSRV